MMQRRRGFTLIELLVVIAIIAILAAILFPVFAKAREKSRAISCLSNCKQLGLALMQYVGDWDEGFPQCPGGNGAMPDGSIAPIYWNAAIQPYTKSIQVFNCPSANRALWWKGDGTVLLNYGFNRELYPNAPAFYRQAQLMEPANTLCIADTTTDDFVTGRTCVIEQYANTNAAFRRWMGDLHLNGSNIIFCDGHAKRFSVQRDANNITVHPQKADGVCWYANASQ